MIKVTAAVIVHEGMLLIAKRKSTARLPNLWELPGGKVEPDETPEECLKREIKEEFDISVTVGKHLYRECVIRRAIVGRGCHYIAFVQKAEYSTRHLHVQPYRFRFRSSSFFCWCRPRVVVQDTLNSS